MATIYFVRHQAAGLLTDYPFQEYPSAAQVAVLADLCARKHGTLHPKTDEPLWLHVAEIEILSPADLPVIPETTLSVASAAGVHEFSVSGTGEVS